MRQRWLLKTQHPHLHRIFLGDSLWGHGEVIRNNYEPVRKLEEQGSGISGSGKPEEDRSQARWHQSFNSALQCSFLMAKPEQDFQTSGQPFMGSQVLHLPYSYCSPPQPSPYWFRLSPKLRQRLGFKAQGTEGSELYLGSEGHSHAKGTESRSFATSQGIKQTQTQGTQSHLSPFSWDFQIGLGLPPSLFPSTLQMESALSSCSVINTSSHCSGISFGLLPMVTYFPQIKSELERVCHTLVSFRSGVVDGCRYSVS